MNTILRPELLILTPDQLQALTPYFWLFGGACLALVLAVMRGSAPKWPVFLVSLAACTIAIVSILSGPQGTPFELFNGMMVSDGFSRFFNVVFLASAALTILASFRYLDRENLQHPEYYLLLLFSALGMMLMTASLDLLVSFIALEIMSLSVYVLVGFRRADRRSNEAAMKYFILGSAASAIMLYGAALLYGATGSTNIHVILAFARSHPQGVSLVYTLGSWLAVLGLLFKVASVPFHMWMPDVYEGAPAPITGFMTTGLKAAAFSTLVRVFISTGYGTQELSRIVQDHLHDIIWISALLTMIVGNIVALTQTNLKRMLAYSSIAHTGYLLMGLLAGSHSDHGYAPVVMYLAVYSIMNIGAFGILTMVSAREDHGLNLHDFSGFAQRRPWMAFGMAVFLLSMAGIPPTAGFNAKYLVFYSAVQAGEIWLVVLGVLCSAISVYYYLRVLVYMYMRDPVGSAPATRLSVWGAAVVATMVVATLQIGVMPERMVQAAKRAVLGL